MALGTLRLLEAIRILGLSEKTRFYQASTSELYGKVQEMPQNEDHAFLSAKPLRCRQALRLLDHRELQRSLRTPCVERHSVQSRKPRCGERPSLLARSPVRWLPSSTAMQETLYLGNLDAKRDWGHARDYVRGMWLMLAAGPARTITCWPPVSVTPFAEFVECAFAEIGITVEWRGEGSAVRRAMTQLPAESW